MFTNMHVRIEEEPSKTNLIFQKLRYRFWFNFIMIELKTLHY